MGGKASSGPYTGLGSGLTGITESPCRNGFERCPFVSCDPDQRLQATRTIRVRLNGHAVSVAPSQRCVYRVPGAGECGYSHQGGLRS
jgi:hypothetical protein